MTTPRIYVACLASYNAGKLHGAWIDASDESDIRDEITEMLAVSPTPGAEEWAIHDYEGFEGLNLGEYPDLEKVALHARMIGEHDGAWAAYVNHVGDHYATEDGFTDSYRGHYRSAEEYAEGLHEDAGTDLGSLANYIDWERYARDLEMGGDYNFIDDPNGGVYVFSNH